MAKPWEITGDDIQSWSQRVEASAVLPDLVRRLLLATSPIGSLDMRADGGTRLRGWDGIVQAFRGSAFCPRGQSVWELSVEGSRTKLDDDFTKRTDNPPPPIRPGATTYIAVTARRFIDKPGWAADRHALGKWIDVRLVDADDLATWLTQAPAVARWFAAQLGKPAYDAIDLDTFVARWKARTSPPLPLELALAGGERQRAAKLVGEWAHAARPQPLYVRGDTREEALVFTAAALALAPSPEGELWRARSLVVESHEALRWAFRVAAAEPLILLPSFDAMEAKLVERTAFVVVPLDAGAPDALRPLTLEPVPHRRFAEILAEAGFPKEEAERRAADSGGKLSALQRLYGDVALPPWAAALDPIPLATMLLVGAFQPENEADREVLRALGAEPRDVENLCERLRILPDAATVREQGRWGHATWTWLAPGDAWQQLAGSIPAETLRRFQRMVPAVLGRPDPRFEMEKKEPFAASQSSALREGLTRSLVRLALNDEALATLHGPRRGSRLADSVVHTLLEPGWMHWASVADLLPLLAEAAPEVFLNRLEESLREEDKGAAHLLAEEARFGNPHTGLLWALETLGWDETYMARVAFALMKLTAYDVKLPDKRLANRPAASLHHLIHFMFAQTRASAEARHAALRRMAGDEIGYDFVIGQINSVGGPGFMMPAHAPQLRPWSPLSEEEMQQRAVQETQQNVEVLVNIALDHVGTSMERWVKLLDAAHRLPEPLVLQIFDRLEASQPSIADVNGAVWAALRRWLHGSASTDDKAQKPPQWRSRVERLYNDVFEPADLIIRYSWLFEPVVEPPDSDRRIFSMDDEELKRRQQKALRQLWSAPDRWELLACFISSIGERGGAIGRVGHALGQADFAEEVEERLLRDTGSGVLGSLLSSYIYGRLKASPPSDWLEGILRRIVDEHGLDRAITVTQGQRPTSSLWQVIDKIGEPLRSAYWQKVTYVADLDPKHDWKGAIANLLAAGNFTVALDAAHQGNAHLTTDVVYKVLRALGDNPEEVQRLLLHPLGVERIESVLSRLEEDPSADAALIEHFDVLIGLASRNPRRHDKHLSAAIEKEFVHLINKIYRRKDDDRVPLGSEGEEREQPALAPYDLLDAWSGYPGEGLSAEAREKRLYQWAQETLQRCAAEGRGDVGAIEVAKVLARAPAGEDGHWPCLAARRLLEPGEHPRLAEGLCAARYNLRGVVKKSIGEDGRQEREIAASFQTSANALRTEWPRTAALLDDLARWYEDQAEEEDADAHADLRRLGAEPEDFAKPVPAAHPTKPSSSEPSILPGIVRLESVRLKDVCAVEDLTLDFAAPALDHGQWIVLLGENGTGKTSILRAIALTLTTYNVAAAALAALPSSPVRGRADEATCAVRCGGHEYRLTLTPGPRGTQIQQKPNGTALRPLVFGYGCRRGSALGGPEVLDLGTELADVSTLFSHSASLYPAFGWLKRQKLLAKEDPERYGGLFEQIATALSDPQLTGKDKGLLPGVARMDVHGDDVWATAPALGGEVPIAALSDGYLTVIGWVIDLVARWLEWSERLKLPRGDDFFKEMTGIVLVDEIDLHLHPRWQLRILSDLRRLFPRLSFVVTTHNPAAVVGAKPEEIWILKNEDGRIRAEQRAEPPKLMTGSEIYTSYFGIPYMYPELAEKMRRYGFLAGTPARTKEEEAEVHRLLRELRTEGLDPGWEPVQREEPPPYSSDDGTAHA